MALAVGSVVDIVEALVDQAVQEDVLVIVEQVAKVDVHLVAQAILDR